MQCDARSDWRLPTLAILIGCLAPLLMAPSSASAQATDFAQQLADKYAPILMLKQQSADCDYDGEGYFPTAVDWLWNNPDILLKAAGDGDADEDLVLKTAPTAQDLVTALPETYLDFVGDPRNPGCTFERYFKQKAAELGLQPTVYAKYVYAPTERRLYLEYWYYFSFNDWNDTHESDWEMLALGFDAETPEQALEMEPVWVGYAQHAGGETAAWDDAKLQREGDHPIAYLSAGSHATYYNAKTMIGWGENGSAFGCDVTTGPSTEIRPTVVVIPDRIDPNGPFAWALYQGRWGQREVAMFSGPGGPNLGSKWNDPAASFESWRTSTLVVPESKALGLNTTGLFCAISERGSRAFVYFGSRPWSVAALVFGLLAAVAIAIWRVWPFFMEALDVYGNDLRTFLGIGLFAVPIGILFNGFRIWASNVPPLEWVEQFFNDSNAGKLTATLLVIVFQQIAMLLLISPAIIFALREIRQGFKPGVWQSYLGGLRHLGSLILPFVALVLAIGVLSWTVVLIPAAIYLLVRWQFFSQAVILDDSRGLSDPLRRSWAATRGQWWRTFMLTLAFQLLGALPGPFIGVLLLILGGANVRFSNTISSILYSAFVPLAMIGVTLAYHRLKGDSVIEPHMSTRERDPAKAAQSRAVREEALRRAGLGATG